MSRPRGARGALRALAGSAALAAAGIGAVGIGAGAIGAGGIGAAGIAAADVAALSSPPKAPVVLFVAACAEGPARVVARMFEGAHYGLSVVVRAEASSRLASDVLAGAAPPDLFFSADSASVDRLVAAGLADPSTRVDLLAAEVVVAGRAPADSDSAGRARPLLASLADLAAPTVRAVALCDSQVPLGACARALLRAAGVWDSVAARALPVTDERAALAAVESGAADYAIVYAPQLENSRKARAVWRPDPTALPPARFPLVLMRRSSRRPEAIALYDLLVSEQASRVFSLSGFRPLLPARPGLLRGEQER